MRTRILFTISFLTLCSVGWVDAQKSDTDEKPVWTLEVMKVRLEMLGPALNYLDEHWMPLRREAKTQGAVLSYRRFVKASLPLSAPSSRKSIFLMTEYKSVSAFADREPLFDSIQKQLDKLRPGLFEEGNPEELYGPIDLTILTEVSDNSGTQFKLLAQE
jgi:hypothetical protein